MVRTRRRSCELLIIAVSQLHLVLIVVWYLSLWAFSSVSGQNIDGSGEVIASNLPFPQRTRLVALFSFEEGEFEVK